MTKLVCPECARILLAELGRLEYLQSSAGEWHWVVRVKDLKKCLRLRAPPMPRGYVEELNMEFRSDLAKKQGGKKNERDEKEKRK